MTPANWIEFADKHATGLWFLAIFALLAVVAVADRFAAAIAVRRREP